MSALKLLLIAGLALAGGWASAAMAPEASRDSAEVAPVAVVELFTSEGCSSCPPADRLLAALAEEAAAQDRRVFPLAFHVDYWDNLGWKDPYSQAEFSDRQADYSRALGERLYTPQMVVNGRHAFVGSDEQTARRLIAEALKAPAPGTLTVEAAQAAGGRAVAVTYRTEKLPEGAVVHLAVVERTARQSVPRGENAGRTLRHANVVRAFATFAPGEGQATLKLPADLDPADAALIAFAQQPETMAILAAARAAF